MVKGIPKGVYTYMQEYMLLTLRFLVLQGSQAMELCGEESLLRPRLLRTFSAMNLGEHRNRFPGLSWWSILGQRWEMVARRNYRDQTT